MRVRWTANAANDLTRIVERIRKNNPSADQRVAQTIYNGDTPELVFGPCPYMAVYEVIEDEVQVLRIRHASQDRPQRSEKS